MSIFNWFKQEDGKDKSCDFHHWEIYKHTNQYRIEPGGRRSYLTDGGGFNVLNKVKKRCQHEGCNATKEEWVEKNHANGRHKVKEAKKLIDEFCEL